MVKLRVMPKEEAQKIRRVKEPGIRRARMNQFSEYVQPLLENPAEAVVFEELGERGQSFVLSLRGAFQRAGLENVVVRKLRGRDEVRAWISDEPLKRKPKPAAVVAPAGKRGRPRKAS